MPRFFYLVTLVLTLIVLGCCKPQADKMECDNNCFHVKGEILCKPDNTPLNKIDVRFRALINTGIGNTACNIIETKTDKNGKFEFRADISEFLNAEDNYTFQILFKDRKYVNSNSQTNDKSTLAKFYSVDSSNAETFIDTTFYLEKE